MEKSNMSEFEQVVAWLRYCAKVDNTCEACPFKKDNHCMSKLLERAADSLLELEKERVLADANYASLHERFENYVKENFDLTKKVNDMKEQVNALMQRKNEWFNEAARQSLHCAENYNKAQELEAENKELQNGLMSLSDSLTIVMMTSMILWTWRMTSRMR